MRIFLLFVFCFYGLANHAFAQQPDYFGSIKTAKQAERPLMAHKLFQQTVVHLDSAVAIPALLALEMWCRNNEDEKLRTTALILIGDFYKQHRNMDKSMQYLQDALTMAKNHHQKDEEATIYNLRAWLHYRNGKYPEAFEDILKSNALVKNEIGEQNYLYTNRNLYDLGYMYYDFGNFKKASICLQEALHYPFASTLDEIGCLNTLGLTYKAEKNYDSATYFFQRIITLAKTINHTAWIGIATGNIGGIYFVQGKYNEALPLLQTDYHLSIEKKEWKSAGYALCMMADINIKNNNYELAARQLQEVTQLEPFNLDMRLRLTYFLKSSMLYSARKQHEPAFRQLDSARLLQIEVSERNNAIVFSQAEQKIAVEQHLAQIDLVKVQEGKKVIIRNFIIVVFLLTLIICGQLIFRQQQKQKRDREQFADANKKLNNYLESIREKNELIEAFKTEIEELQPLPDYYTDNIITKEKEELADKLKKYTILTEDHWNEFRHLFSKVHAGFFDSIKEKYPLLTQSEIRLLALTKLNLSRKEMAEMLGISPDSIKKTRQRIRKKVDLPKELEIEDMVK